MSFLELIKKRFKIYLIILTGHYKKLSNQKLIKVQRLSFRLAIHKIMI